MVSTLAYKRFKTYRFR